MKEIIKTIFQHLDDNLKQKWFTKVSHLIYPDSKWEKFDLWMEKQFIKELSQTPRKVAFVCMHYFRINRKMSPAMIKLARKVKKRVYMRMKRLKDTSKTQGFAFLKSKNV